MRIRPPAGENYRQRGRLMPREDIARLVGLSVERVDQILQEAERKIASQIPPQMVLEWLQK